MKSSESFLVLKTDLQLKTSHHDFIAEHECCSFNVLSHRIPTRLLCTSYILGKISRVYDSMLELITIRSVLSAYYSLYAGPYQPDNTCAPARYNREKDTRM